jgi:putative redox protein
MKTTSEILYTGQLSTKATHSLSGKDIVTDAPLDNQGKGETFSPTDLVATALGSCMLTVIGIKAKDSGFDIDGAQVEIIKHMGSQPRRIAEIEVSFIFPAKDYSEKTKQIIINTAKTCPVAKSLHPDLKQTITFNFQ